MQLTDDERALLDGRGGKAKQKAMELLVRYAEALGAQRFVATTNVAGVPGQGSVFLANYYNESGGGRDAIFSYFDLDSDELVEMPPVVTHACHLQGGYDPENWQLLGATEQAAQVLKDTEKYAADRGVKILKTCTPYLVGNVPKMGEHCAWMESSAVIYCNSVLGARTNTEGRESTSAAMLTGKIPDFGFHQDHYRRGTHKIEVDWADRQPHGLGHARLLRRRSGGRANSGARRQARCAGPGALQALRCGGRIVGRRRDVPHRRRDARSSRPRPPRSAATDRSRPFVTGRPSANAYTRR